MKRLDKIELYQQKHGSKPIVVMGYLRHELYGQVLTLNIETEASSAYGFVKPGMTLSSIGDLIQRTLVGHHTILRVIDVPKAVEQSVHFGFSEVCMVMKGMVNASGKELYRTNKETNSWVSAIITKPSIHINARMANYMTPENCYGKCVEESHNKKKKRT